MTRIPIQLAFSVLLCFLSQVGFCSQEWIVPPAEVSIRADAGAPFGEVSVSVHAKESNSERVISDMKLLVGGKSVSIPKKAYSDLGSPLLNTVELRTDEGYDKEPWLYIYFEVAYQTLDGQWRPKRVHIAYHEGRIQARSIQTPTADGSFDYVKDEL